MVALADFREDRAFYLNKYIFVGGKGEPPGNHGADMAQLISGEGNYYVLDLMVSHP
jgi:hypothetical protein